MRMRIRALFSLALVLALATGIASGACGGSKGGKPKTGGGDGGKTGPEPTAAACDAHRDKLARLYAAAITETAPDKKAAAQETIPDNVQMVLIDCRTNPAKFAPCLERATSVAQVERECVVPIDDAGRAEGRQFGKSAPAGSETQQ